MLRKYSRAVKVVVDILLFFVSFILASIICDGQFLSHGEWTASILNALLSMLLLAALQPLVCRQTFPAHSIFL